MGYDRYSYVQNNPINYVDPSGHYPCGAGYYDSGCKIPQNPLVVGLSGIDNSVSSDGPDFGVQMPAWVDVVDINQKYEGTNPDPADTNASKREQAELAFGQITDMLEQNPGVYDSIEIVGLSGGADTAIMLAVMLEEAGIDVSSMAILGPTFSGLNPDGSSLLQDTWEDDLDYLTKSGVSVLVVEDESSDVNEQQRNYVPPEHTTGTYQYHNHSGIDHKGHPTFPKWDHLPIGSNEARRNQVLGWINAH
jgi:hypothetical protein